MRRHRWEFQNQRLRQDVGPGRSTRCARVREFQDQRPIWIPHEVKPLLPKLNTSGPNFIRLRKWIGIVSSSLKPVFQVLPIDTAPYSHSIVDRPAPACAAEVRPITLGV